MFQQCVEFGREFAIERYSFAGVWVGEGEALGVEEKAVELIDGAFDLDVSDGVVAAFVVGGVADDGVIDRCEVDADLVCAAGPDVDIEKSEFLEPFSYLPDR